MNVSTYPLSAPAPAAGTDARRLAAPFVPFTRIPVRTIIWSVLLGIGVVCPLVIGLGWLPVPYNARLAALAHERWVGYSLHPGALFLKAVLIVPLLEEIFYRGLVLQLLRRYSPIWFAVLISAAF